jgi:hypothetical protein
MMNARPPIGTACAHPPKLTRCAHLGEGLLARGSHGPFGILVRVPVPRPYEDRVRRRF